MENNHLENLLQILRLRPDQTKIEQKCTLSPSVWWFSLHHLSYPSKVCITKLTFSLVLVALEVTCQSYLQLHLCHGISSSFFSNKCKKDLEVNSLQCVPGFPKRVCPTCIPIVSPLSACSDEDMKKTIFIVLHLKMKREQICILAIIV